MGCSVMRWIKELLRVFFNTLSHYFRWLFLYDRWLFPSPVVRRTLPIFRWCRPGLICGYIACFVSPCRRWLCNCFRRIRDSIGVGYSSIFRWMRQLRWIRQLFVPYETSACSVENVRYRLGEKPHVEHDNEDRWFEINSRRSYQVVALFDGHDGPLAVDHVREYVNSRLKGTRSVTLTTLQGLFVETESNFFDSIRAYVEERQRLQNTIPLGMKSYQASQLYPREVARLEELEPLISGGCTAVVAVVCGNKLYVANVGDSRAVVVYQTPNGALETLQLSTDHDVKNEDELKRLEKLGLDPEELKRAGRLGPQENTRSIGDYNIKAGYQNVDVLRHASGPPGTAVPSVKMVDIDRSFLYLMVMSDGVYKSIEAALDEAQTIGANQVLANMVHTYAQTPGVGFSSIAQSTLDQVAHLHEEAFQRSAQQDARSPKATACRKRDDMTLVVCPLSGK